MYHFIEDKQFLKNMHFACSDLMNQLITLINQEGSLCVETHLVGSGAKHLETQNNDNPVDLDFNLVILKIIDPNLKNEGLLKNFIKDCFDQILIKNDLEPCKDSTSVLTTGKIQFKRGNQTCFSIDAAIVRKKGGIWQRLIHQKTGFVSFDRWFWNDCPKSNGLEKKVKWIKENNLWEDLRKNYLQKKNLYLSRSDDNHPSFICYIEAVNEIFYLNN